MSDRAPLSPARAVSERELDHAQDVMIAIWHGAFTFCPDCGHKVADHFHGAACMVRVCDCTSPSSAVMREQIAAALQAAPAEGLSPERLREIANQLDNLYWSIGPEQAISRKTIRLLAEELRKGAAPAAGEE